MFTPKHMSPADLPPTADTGCSLATTGLDHLGHQAVWRAADDRLSGTVNQHKLDLPSLCYFVHTHQRKVAARVVLSIQHGRHHGQTGPLYQTGQSIHILGIDQTQALRQARSHDHATTHRLTVQPLAISHAGLNGVAKGVTEVEDRAKTSLSFIGTHHLGFDFTAAPNRESQCDGITGSQLVQIGLDPVETNLDKL